MRRLEQTSRTHPRRQETKCQNMTGYTVLVLNLRVSTQHPAPSRRRAPPYERRPSQNNRGVTLSFAPVPIISKTPLYTAGPNADGTTAVFAWRRPGVKSACVEFSPENRKYLSSPLTPSQLFGATLIEGPNPSLSTPPYFFGNKGSF